VPPAPPGPPPPTPPDALGPPRARVIALTPTVSARLGR